MKEKLERIDRFLSAISLKGDELMYMAEARFLLREVYDSIKTDEVKQEDGRQ